MPPSLSEVLSADACLHLRVLLEHTCYVDMLRSVGQECSQCAGRGKVVAFFDSIKDNVDFTLRWVPLYISRSVVVFAPIFLH